MTDKQIYFVCNEYGQVLHEHFSEIDALENCDWSNGEFVSRA